VDLGNKGTFGRYSRGGAENVGESAYVVNEWRDLWGETGNGDETECEEEVVEDSSSTSSDSEDLTMGGMFEERFWWGSHPNEPPAAGSGRARFLSDHWLDLLWNVLGPISELSSGVAGAGDSVEDEEEEEAGRGGCGVETGGSRIAGG